MIKKFFAIVALMLIACLSLTGCGGDRYTKIKIEGSQDLSYVVTSNGGNAVAYGNYVYFINGTRGYEDTDAKANVFGEVIKGAVYRAELLGKRNDGSFIVERDSVTLLGMKSHKESDYKRDEIDVIDVQAIAPKTAGTSGYSGGGLFILGDSIYFASPNNLKNKTGEVQYLKTDFFKMTLDGKSTKKIYTTEEDSASSPYMFYSAGEFVYLVVLDGTDLISVKIEKKNGKVEDTLLIAEDVTDAVMPTKPVYYDGVNENTIYDFVYFERAATKDDLTQAGEILELIRPDGTNRTIFEADGKNDYTLETVKDGYLFYRKQDNYQDKLFARNMHLELAVADEAYKNANADAVDVEKEVLSISDLSSVDVYPFVPDFEFGKTNVSNRVDVVTLTKAAEDGSTSSFTMNYYRAGGFECALASGSAVSFDTANGSDVYFTADGTLKKAAIGAGEVAITDIATDVVSGTYGADVVSGYLVYFGKVGEVSGYACFKEIDGLEGNNDAKFVGAYSEEDKPSTVEEIIIVEQPTKTTYNIGDKIDLSGLVIEAKAYADSNGNRPENTEVEITDDMISGFDSSAAGEITVTVTYEKRTADITMTIVDPEAETENTEDGEKTEEEKSSCASVAPIDPWFFIGGGGMLILAGFALFAGKKKANTVA